MTERQSYPDDVGNFIVASVIISLVARVIISRSEYWTLPVTEGDEKI